MLCKKQNKKINIYEGVKHQRRQRAGIFMTILHGSIYPRACKTCIRHTQEPLRSSRFERTTCSNVGYRFTLLNRSGVSDVFKRSIPRKKKSWSLSCRLVKQSVWAALFLNWMTNGEVILNASAWSAIFPQADCGQHTDLLDTWGGFWESAVVV